MQDIDAEAVRESFLERAAIMEHDGGLPKAEAEAAVIAKMDVYGVDVWKDEDKEVAISMTVIRHGVGRGQMYRDMRAMYADRLISVKRREPSDIKAILRHQEGAE